MKTPNTPEPPPLPSDQAPVWDLVLVDIKERDAMGTAKYGQRLTPGDGRDSLVDAYQESLDLCVYLRKAIEERRPTMSDTPYKRTGLPPGWYWAPGGPQPHAMADEGGGQCYITEADSIRTRGDVPFEVSDAVTLRHRKSYDSVIGRGMNLGVYRQDDESLASLQRRVEAAESAVRAGGGEPETYELSGYIVIKSDCLSSSQVAVVSSLVNAWSRWPSERLGQLILNATRRDGAVCKDCAWHASNDDMIEMLDGRVGSEKPADAHDDPR